MGRSQNNVCRTSAAFYRQRAEEAEAPARRITTGSFEQEALLKIAAQFRALEESACRREQGRSF